jgi:hypothetical protein
MRRLLAPLALALLALGAAVGPAPARADMVQTLRPGQAFYGDVPAGEPMRLTVELARDAELRLQFTFQVTGADTYLPANFQRVSVSDEEGKPVPFDQKLWTNARYDPRRRNSTFYIRGWKAPAGGRYTFAVTHLTKSTTRCTGRVGAVRTLRTRFEGDATATSFTVPVQPDDLTKIAVKRVDGTAPEIASFALSGGTPAAVSQKRTKSGSTSRAYGSWGFGDATWAIGYQAERGPPGGRFKGTITVTPGGPYGKAALELANSVGIALSVRNVDAFLDVPWAAAGAGVSWDALHSYLLVTGESSGQVLGKYYNADLTDPGPLAPPVVLATSADFPPGESLSGHRVIRAGDRHVLAITSASGRNAALARFPYSLARDGFAPLVDASSDPTTDLFLATDGFSVSVGLPRPPDGHTVHVIDVATLQPASAPVSIGSASRPHSAGASAVFRTDQNVFELWAPDSLAPGVASDLNHGLFGSAWGALTWEAARVAGDGVSNPIETMCSSVVLDEATGVTILHYVVPTLDASGLGILHRRLFDPLGAEVPNSHATLGTVRRNRPAATIVGDFLYVAAEGETRPSVTRFQLLR